MTRVSAGPVRWKDGRGRWRDFDFDLRSGDDGVGYAAQAGPAEVTLPSALGTGESATITTSHGSVQTWLEGADAPASARDTTATYQDALPDVTVKMRAVAEGLKEDLVLESVAAPTDFAYRVRLSSGLAARVNRAGTVEIVKAGRPVFTIPRPVVTDAGGYAAAPPRYRLERLAGDSYRLSYRVDERWLRERTRAWPVTVDPTVVPVIDVDPVRTCLVTSVATLVGDLAQEYDRLAPDCDNPNRPRHDIGGEIGTGWDYSETGVTIEFPWVYTGLLQMNELVDSAHLVLWKEAGGAGQTSGLRAIAGEDYDDPARTVIASEQAARTSVRFDVTDIVWQWRSFMLGTGGGFAQEPFYVTENAYASLLLESSRMTWEVSYSCMYEPIDCAHGWTGIASSTHPDLAKRPYLELTMPPQHPLLEVEPWTSWQHGRVSIVNTGEAPFDVDRVEILEGDLTWSEVSDPDACSGTELAPRDNACTLALDGSRGVVRLWEGGEARDVDVDLGSYPPTPLELPDPARGPFLHAERTSVNEPVMIIDSGAEPAAITNVELVYGNLQWAGSESDSCTGATVAVGAGCELRLDGGMGVVRFTLAGGHSQDMTIDLDGLVPEAPAPDAVNQWPDVWMYHPDGVDGEIDVAPRPTVATGIFTLVVAAEDPEEVHSVSATIDGNPLGTYTGTTWRGCNRPDRCLPDCESLLYADPTRTCIGWYWDTPHGWARFRFDSSRLADGVHTIRAEVTDRQFGTLLPEHTVRQEWKVVVDNHPPFVNVSNGLYDSRGQDRLKSGTVTVSADDAGSGVASIKLLETTGGGTTLLAQSDRGCGPVCVPTAMSADLTVDPIARGWADGPHSMRVEVRDGGGFMTRTDWSVEFYRAAWLYGGLDDQVDFDALKHDLRTRADYEALWAMLRTPDKARIFAESDEGLFRERSDAAVYVVRSSVRHWVTSPAVADEFDLDLSTVQVVPDGLLSMLPRGADLVSAGVPGAFDPAPSSDFIMSEQATKTAYFWMRGGRRVPFARADYLALGLTPPSASFAAVAPAAAPPVFEPPTSRATYTPNNRVFFETDPLGGPWLRGTATYSSIRGQSSLYWQSQFPDTMPLLRYTVGATPLRMDAYLFSVRTGRQLTYYRAHRIVPAWWELHSKIPRLRTGVGYQLQIDRRLSMRVGGASVTAVIQTNHRFVLALV
ncbi:hypothetical protein VSS74_11210 [Conexibacter stalactiti]|uniref:Ig-like domain-containing protein n=1 Tax=Conexibacter stalactiti TaxID=1940611 RepID=A0ABU4HNN6_9ACTN|nr:hypothetical protein [Conexibacter stalactiti]MDW5594911.1 hypothetical protein [Conexibacter stalactiti]MEC5035553.1 hypothetical protein [Conexibacter stalactiti]